MEWLNYGKAKQMGIDKDDQLCKSIGDSGGKEWAKV
jgi:hypothetical protein